MYFTGIFTKAPRKHCIRIQKPLGEDKVGGLFVESALLFQSCSVGGMVLLCCPLSEFHCVNSFIGPISISFHWVKKKSHLAWSGHCAPLQGLGLGWAIFCDMYDLQIW